MSGCAPLRLGMHDLPLDVQRSFRRGRLYRRILLALDDRNGRAYPEELARALHVSQFRLHEAMHGKRPRYRRALCPLHLQLVRKTRDAYGIVYVVAPRGAAILTKMGRRRRRSGGM
jgi:predicted transcriptional regulator with HTH domain